MSLRFIKTNSGFTFSSSAIADRSSHTYVLGYTLNFDCRSFFIKLYPTTPAITGSSKPPDAIAATAPIPTPSQAFCVFTSSLFVSRLIMMGLPFGCWIVGYALTSIGECWKYSASGLLRMF